MTSSMEPRILGRTGLKVGPLGLAGGYGAPATAFEEAFEKGCNYFYWGSLRKSGMREAIRNICANGKRDDLVIVLQSYSRSPFLMELFVKRALKTLELDHADILLLGWHNKRPSPRILEKAFAMEGEGMYRFLGVSGHNRELFPELHKEGVFDVFHVRYNAAHRGAEQDIFPFLEGTARPGIVTYTATSWRQLLNPKKMPAGNAPLSGSDCYRFALSNPSVDVCVTGPKNQGQMREALRTLELGPLSEQDLRRVRQIGDYVRAHSGRFFSQ